MRIILLLAIAAVVLSADYCETASSSANVFVTPQERRLFPLGSYIKGSDLVYSLDDPSSVKLYNPLTVVDKQVFGKPGYAFTIQTTLI